MSNVEQYALSHALLPHAKTIKKDKAEERVKDEGAGARRIAGNIHFRHNLLNMQRAKNYHMERDRLQGLLAENRIPGNREMIKQRVKHLDDKISEIDDNKK